VHAYVNMFLPKLLDKMKNLKAKYILKYKEVIWAKFASNYILIILRRIPNKNLYLPFFLINKATADILDSLLMGKETQSIIIKLAKENHISRKCATRDFKSILATLKKQDLLY